MEEMLQIAKETMEEFNPETDSVSDFEPIPDGEYNVLLEEVELKESQGGTPNISFKYSVIDGEQEGKFIWDNHYLTLKTIKFQTKKLAKIAFILGFELPVDTFNSYERIVEVFNQMAGTTGVGEKTTNKSGYSNFELTA